MPKETIDAIEWALKQTVKIDDMEFKVVEHLELLLVDKVREYFNEHGIEYNMFSYDDLKPYLSN
ncbi:MAG: hypothetical protein FWJ66_11980 [Caldibacillus sp.]